MILPVGRYMVAAPLRIPPLNEMIEILRSLASATTQSPSILPFTNVACDMNGALNSRYGSALSTFESLRAVHFVHRPFRSPKLYCPSATTSPVGENIFHWPWLT